MERDLMTMRFAILCLILTLVGCQPTETLSLTNFTPTIEIEHPSFEGYRDDARFIRFEDPKTKLMGIKDSKGKILIPAKFYMIHNFNQWGIGDAVLSKKNPGQFVKIDTTGKILTQSYFFDNGPDYFYRDRARFVSPTGKIGFINHKAEIVIPAEFDHAISFHFHEPITFVCKGGKDVCFDPPGSGCHHNHKIIGGKWGLIDTTGKIVIPLEFDDYRFEGDSLMLLKESQSFKIFKDQNGTYVTQPVETKSVK
jgi:hypothetical protein